MPEVVADPPSRSCYLLLSGAGIEESHRLDPDPLLSRPRDARGRFAKGGSGNPRDRPRDIPNPKRRVPDLVARPLSAQALSDLNRPQASSVAAPRRASLAAAARLHRPGGASRDRPVVVAHGRGFPPGADRGSGGHFSRQDRARRGRAHRAAGACPATRGPVSRAIWASVGRVNPNPLCRPRKRMAGCAAAAGQKTPKFLVIPERGCSPRVRDP
jgi:hypothetical protein